MGLAVESIYIDVLLNGKKAQMGLKQFNKQLKALNKPVKGLTGMFGKMFKFAGIAGFAKMAFDAQKLGRELGLISTKTGIAASKLSQMQNAFAATGGDAKNLTNVLTSITSGLARISMGGGEMAAKLSAMGINAWDNSGKVKKSDVVLGDIAEWTRGQLEMGRSMQEISQFLQENFGITQDLANQLALGREGFAKYQAELAKTTGSLEEDEISNLQSLNASLARFKQTVVVLTEKIAAGLAPVIEFITDVFQIFVKNAQDVFDYLFDAFEDIVGSGEDVCQLFEILKGVLTGFTLIGKALVDVLKGFFQAVKKMGEWIGNFLAWVANKFGWLAGSTDDSPVDEKNRKNVEEYIRNNNLSEEEANNLRMKWGLGKREKLFSTEIQPTFPEIRIGENGLETVGGATIIVENETTINANTNATPEEIAGAIEDVNDDSGDIIAEKSGTGGY